MTAMEKWDGRDKPTTSVEVLPRDERPELALPDDLTRDEWEGIGKKLRDAAEWTQWKIGEWLNFGERKWGDGSFVGAAAILGYSERTVRNIASITNNVSRRRDDLSFSHHAEVASLEPEAQERWLDKAEENDWSTRELREQMRLTRDHDVTTETVAIPQCKRCRKECNWCRIELTPDSSTSTRRRR